MKATLDAEVHQLIATTTAMIAAHAMAPLLPVLEPLRQVRMPHDTRATALSARLPKIGTVYHHGGATTTTMTTAGPANSLHDAIPVIVIPVMPAILATLGTLVILARAQGHATQTAAMTPKVHLAVLDALMMMQMTDTAIAALAALILTTMTTDVGHRHVVPREGERTMMTATTIEGLHGARAARATARLTETAAIPAAAGQRAPQTGKRRLELCSCHRLCQ